MTKQDNKDSSNATGKGRGRPRKFDQEKLLDGAQQLFHSQGYDNVGIAQLTADLGIKPPSLYAAYGSKLGLFTEVVSRYSAREGQFIGQAAESSASVKQGLRDILAAAADIYSRNETITGCMVLEGAHRTHEEGARAICLAKRAATEEYIAEFVAREYPAQSRDVASMTMIALAGLSAGARTGLSAKALQKFANLSADGLIALCDNGSKK